MYHSVITKSLSCLRQITGNGEPKSLQKSAGFLVQLIKNGIIVLIQKCYRTGLDIVISTNDLDGSAIRHLF